MATDTFDAIVIGGGHNGLVNAGYLAKAGLKTLLLERRHLVGGAAITEELVPGYQFTTFSYAISLLRPDIVQDLDLVEHGLMVMPLINTFQPDRNGDYLFLGADADANYHEIARHSATDAEAARDLDHIISRVCRALKPWMDRIPPNALSQEPAELAAMAELRACGVDVRRTTVYSKCGQPPRNAPNGSILETLPNVGRCDHAYAMHAARRYDRLEPLVFFLKDSSRYGSRADYRRLNVGLCGVARAAAGPVGFGCGRRPYVDGSAYHWAPALLAYSLIEVHAHAWDQAARPAAALDFFGPFPTLGARLAATPGVLRADELQRRAVVPVCYGGTLAVRRDRLVARPPKFWRTLVESFICACSSGRKFRFGYSGYRARRATSDFDSYSSRCATDGDASALRFA